MSLKRLKIKLERQMFKYFQQKNLVSFYILCVLFFLLHNLGMKYVHAYISYQFTIIVNCNCSNVYINIIIIYNIGILYIQIVFSFHSSFVTVLQYIIQYLFSLLISTNSTRPVGCHDRLVDKLIFYRHYLFINIRIGTYCLVINWTSTWTITIQVTIC